SASAGPPRGRQPAGEEAQPSERGNSAEPPRPAQGEEVEAAREEQGAREEEPAGGAQRRRRPARERPGNAEQREPVIHLVPRPRLEGGEQLRAEPRSQSVGAEGPRRHGDERR